MKHASKLTLLLTTALSRREEVEWYSPYHARASLTAANRSRRHGRSGEGRARSPSPGGRSVLTQTGLEIPASVVCLQGRCSTCPGRCSEGRTVSRSPIDLLQNITKKEIYGYKDVIDFVHSLLFFYNWNRFCVMLTLRPANNPTFYLQDPFREEDVSGRHTRVSDRGLGSPTVTGQAQASASPTSRLKKINEKNMNI